MLIREASIQDVEQLTAMRIEFLHCDFPDITTEEKENLVRILPGYFTEHIGVDFFSYVAEEVTGKVVACAFLVIDSRPANPHFPTGKTGTVLNVFTSETYRRQGIMTMIMQRLLQRAAKQDVSYVDLSATEAGRPLYEKLGFTEKKGRDYTEMRLVL